VRVTYEDKFIGEKRETTNLVITDALGRVNIVVAMGSIEENGLKFVENPNMGTIELRNLFPTAYVVRMRDLMSDSLKTINKRSTQKHLASLTESFSSFALNHGISIDSLADPDHTLPDTMRKILSLELNARIHHEALKLLEGPDSNLVKEIQGLMDEANRLDTNPSFGGTGRMFYRKLSALIDDVYAKIDESTVKYITDLITVADWLKLGIDKTSLENKVFKIYKQFKEDPKGKLAALKPMFGWLNFEVDNV
jgi:hypothetical protein